MLYQVVLRLFAALPLAALVEGKALVLHGGLFRTPPPPQRGKPRAKTLQDIDGALNGLRCVILAVSCCVEHAPYCAAAMCLGGWETAPNAPHPFLCEGWRRCSFHLPVALSLL